MKHFNRKIKYALLITVILLAIFICFSKAGILFSTGNKNIVTVSTSKKTFDPSNYVAKATITDVVEEETTTTTATTTTVTTTTTTTTEQVTTTEAYAWGGDVLSKSKGVVIGPSGKETYYNLDMSGVIRSMRNAGYSESEYPYWVRDDGVKMLGDYVIIAANYSIRPKGTIIPSSLGYAIVCDTGSFVNSNATQIDIAVTWR